ncbi:MAG: tRNA wybutosine-synthesizing 3 family protein [Candidatus Woesearchaeota archaeon]
MNFKHEKEQCLKKKDKSCKKSFDKRILPLLDIINRKENYYTTSSCSGRIILIEKPGRKKQECRWILASHDKVSFKQLKDSLKGLSKKPVWFQFESFIIHVCCRDLDSANTLLRLIKELGFKRSGIISMHNRIIIEVIGTEMMQTIVADKGKVLVDDAYLKEILDQANKKLILNQENIKKLEKKLNI